MKRIVAPALLALLLIAGAAHGDTYFVSEGLAIGGGWQLVSFGEGQLATLEKGGVTVRIAPYAGGSFEDLFAIEYVSEGESRIRTGAVIAVNDSLYLATADAPSSYGTDELRQTLEEFRGAIAEAPEYVSSPGKRKMPQKGVIDDYLFHTVGTLPLSVNMANGITKDGYVSFSVKTSAEAAVFVSADGSALAYAKANEKGEAKFNVRLPSDKPEQALSIYAALDGKAALYETTILCATRELPLTVLYSQDEVETGSFDLYVYTLPRTQFILTTPFSKTRAVASDFGVVYFSLSIRSGASNEYKADAHAEGYGERSASVTLTRGASFSEGLGAFKRTAAALDWRRAKDSAETYIGRGITFRGRIESVTTVAGYPALIIGTANIAQGVWTNPVCVVTPYILTYEAGKYMTVYGEVVSKSDTLPSAYEYEGETIPVIWLEYYE
ncbi:MAG: hypothetical protein LBD16_05780 [Oscillospiraceae bacterium]|nr:hypothetical protein [Oscillospiraceae bacterium]